MQEIGISELKLNNVGWKRIDDAALRVAGPIRDIIHKMQHVLRDDEVRSLCRSLGIQSSGFLFHDTLAKHTRFYNLSHLRHQRAQTYRTDYIWNNPEAKRSWDELIHWLFVCVRTFQYKYAKKTKSHTEDYFLHLPFDSNESVGISNAIPESCKDLCIHYCTFGEMLFTIILWRSLSAASTRGDGKVSIDSFSLGLGQPSGIAAKCSWQGADLLQSPMHRKNKRSCQRSSELRMVWGQNIGPQTTWRAEWDMLHVLCDSKAISLERHALICFATKIGILNAVTKPFNVTDEYLNDVIQRSTNAFLMLLKVEQVRTVDEALLSLERHARFPILPFYAWIMLDGTPKSYFVLPVWTSQNNSIVVRGVHCRHLGLALSAVAPIIRIDWTLPSSFSKRYRPHVSDADPLVIANVLRLMARPLVEGHLYQKVMDAYSERFRQSSEDAIRKVMSETRRKGIKRGRTA